jgi:hypothetical protein
MESVTPLGPALTGPALQIVTVEKVPPALRAVEDKEIREADDPGLGTWLEEGPAANILFRPEEVHPASHERQVLRIRSQRPWAVAVADDSGRVDGLEMTVAHLQHDPVGAIETRRVDSHGLAGEEPA